jgi:hypothetical protein
MNQLQPEAYGPVFAPLLSTDRRRSLGEGAPDAEARGQLEDLSVKSAFAHAQVVDRDMAACCISAVWLLYDELDRSHTISQGIETTSGSCWHGIMHRREGDFSNSKYWFRRVGRHDAFGALAARAAELATARGHSKIGTVPGGQWDPFVFVDLCQQAVRGNDSALRDLCLDIQQAEWELLFDHCYRAAIGQ